MKKTDNTKKTDSKRFMYPFPRAGFGEIREFLDNHYPEKETTKPKLMSLKKAKESGLIPPEEKVTSYKALFIEYGPLELNPYIVFVNDGNFMDKLKTWYFSEEHSRWVEKKSEEVLKSLEGYYND